MLALAAATLSAWTLTAAAAQTYFRGSAEDPSIRSAIFLGEDQRFLSAVTELLKLQRNGGDTFEAGRNYWAALAEYQLSFGMRDNAEHIYRTVAAAAADPSEYGRARLRLAEFEYERGYLDQARATLLQAREKLPPGLEVDWQDLYSRVLLALGRYNEAIEILDDSLAGDDLRTAYLRFNLGVAMINDGRLAEGRTALDRVGRQLGEDEETRALRDKANVTLGWHFLQNQLGGSAKPVFGRVRAVGPHSNRALLGMGWAELAPQGGRQTRTELSEDQDQRQLNDPLNTFSALGVLLRRGYLADPYERAGIRSFQRSGVAEKQDEGYRRAIAIWSELLDRNPLDPAVQEAWLALPYALDQLGAHTQALSYYEQAAERLDRARTLTQDAMKSLRSGRMVDTILSRDADSESGWMWELRDLPDAPETYALQSLIAEHRYAETLKNYRDVRMMLRLVEGWEAGVARIDAVFRTGSARSTVEPTVQFARAKQNWVLPYRDLDLSLDEATQLSAPGQFLTRPDFREPVLPPLKLSAVPSRFDGPYERAQGIKKRSESLKPALEAAARASAKRLLALGLEELNAQRRQIDKYLVETRFALARIYDGALPEPDQDEFELDEDGNPIRETELIRGEFEIDKDRPLADQLPATPAVGDGAETDEFEVK